MAPQPLGNSYNATKFAGSGKLSPLWIFAGSPIERIAHEALRKTDEGVAGRVPVPSSLDADPGWRAGKSIGPKLAGKGSTIPTRPSAAGSCRLEPETRAMVKCSA